VVRTSEARSFVVADIPGLIEGAADGAGLGHRFLRHLARTRLLLHLVDLAPLDTATDPVHDARAIVKELRRYDEALYEKPRWLVLNKLDLIPEEEREARVAAFVKAYRWKGPVFAITAINGEGCRALIFRIQDWLDANRVPAAKLAADAAAILDGDVQRLDDAFHDREVHELAGACRVEVDDMQRLGALVLPVARQLHRVVAEHGDVVEVTATQAHRLAGLDVDGGEHDHEVPASRWTLATNPASRASPTLELFSGWNCTAQTLSRATAATTFAP